MPKLQYPPTGPATYEVTIENDGAIYVRPDDWLSKYSMCIHGVPDMIEEYGRVVSGQIQQIPRSTADFITAGETIYHLPTRRIGRLPKKPTPRELTPAQREKLIDDFLRNHADLPVEQGIALKKNLSRINNGQKLVVLLMSMNGVELSMLLSTASAVLGPLVMTINNIIALINAMEAGYRLSGSIGYCYGFTAWAFREPKPGYSRQLAKNHEHNGHPGHKPVDLKDTLWWSRFVETAFQQGPAAAKEVNMSPEAYQVLLQSYFDQDSAALCRHVANIVHSRIAGRIERDAFAAAVFSYYFPCIYNK